MSDSSGPLSLTLIARAPEELAEILVELRKTIQPPQRRRKGRNLIPDPHLKNPKIFWPDRD